MEELIENWEKRMNAYRLEADTVKSHVQSIKAMHNFMMLRDCVRELKQQLTLGGVGCSLPTKEEVDLEANKQAMFKNIWGEERQSLSKYQGFMNCVNWYAEKIKK